MLFKLLIFSFIANADCVLPDSDKLQGPRLQAPSIEKSLFQHGQTAEKIIADSDNLKLLVWNIYKNKKKSFHSSAAQLLPDYDFVLLQENVYTSKWLTEACQFFPHKFTAGISFWQTNHLGTGVSTGSIYKSRRHLLLRSDWKEPLVNTAKLALVSEYEIKDGRKLMLVNLHGINFVLNKGLANQLNEVRDNIKAHQGPLIVAGDFNTHTSGRFKILNSFKKDLGLQLVKLKNDGRTRKLDHILVREINVLAAEVLSAYKGASDHLPLSLEFHLKP